MRDRPGQGAAVKTLGLLGGMSWESTVSYYQTINRTVAARLGGLHSAQILLYSVDFHEIEALQQAQDWDGAGRLLANAAGRLEAAGAELLVLCTNTMHRSAAHIEAAVRIPFLHIADATAAAIRRAGLEEVGLLGTAFTMEQDFYAGRLEREHGLRVRVPPPADRAVVHRIIYDELCRGDVRDESRQEIRRILAELADEGAAGVILGCTELGLLVGAEDSPVPLFDTAEIHGRAAAERSLEGTGA